MAVCISAKHVQLNPLCLHLRRSSSLLPLHRKIVTSLFLEEAKSRAAMSCNKGQNRYKWWVFTPSPFLSVLNISFVSDRNEGPWPNKTKKVTKLPSSNHFQGRDRRIFHRKRNNLLTLRQNQASARCTFFSLCVIVVNSYFFSCMCKDGFHFSPPDISCTVKEHNANFHLKYGQSHNKANTQLKSSPFS